jgi:glycine cleavage system aminomethyltransferase T
VSIHSAKSTARHSDKYQRILDAAILVIAEHGYFQSRVSEIADKAGRVIGKVTSGGFGPSLNAPVAMGYVESAFGAVGTPVDLMVRGKALPAIVAPMPFVPHNYRRPQK